MTLAFPLLGQVANPPENRTPPEARPRLAKLPAPQPLPNTGRVSHHFTKDPDAYVMIHNLEPSEHLFIRFEEPKSGKLVASMFIRAGAAFSISNQMVLPPDEYVVKVASGKTWYGVDAAFGPNGSYTVLQRPIRLEAYTRLNLQLQGNPQGSGLRQAALPWRQFGGAATNASVSTNDTRATK